MISSPEQPTNPSYPQRVSLLEASPHHFQDEIELPAAQIGAEKWEEMLQKTKETGREYDIVVSRRGSKVLVSKINEGFGERIDYDTGKNLSPSFTPPIFPHGIIKGLFSRVEDLVSVHTHPETEDTKQLPTTTFSAGDISLYVNGRYRTLIAIDRGGVHLLIGINPYINRKEIDPKKIVDEAHKEAQKNTKTVAEVKEEIARSLGRYGIQYYFTSDIKPTEDGFIKFANVLKPG